MVSLVCYNIYFSNMYFRRLKEESLVIIPGYDSLFLYIKKKHNYMYVVGSH